MADATQRLTAAVNAYAADDEGLTPLAWNQVRADIAALLRGDEQAKDAERWRPIETAPKDGRHILVSDGIRVSLGGWVSDVDHGADYEGQIGMAGWWSVDLGPNGDRPTHWMPMPDAARGGKHE